MFLLKRVKFIFILSLVSGSKYERLNKRINYLEEKLFFDSKEFREEISLLKLNNNVSYEQNKQDVIKVKHSDHVIESLVLLKRALSEEKSFTRRSITMFAEAMNNFEKLTNMFTSIKTEIKDIQETCDKRIKQRLDHEKREERKMAVLNDKVNGVTEETKLVLQKISKHVEVQESISKSLWHVFRKSFYFIGRESITWTEAVEKCKAMKGYLTEIDDSAENEFLINLADSIFAEYENYGTWIGGSDLHEEGSWLWENSGSDIKFVNWNNNEPNGDRKENCLHIYRQHDWRWNDLNCSRKMAYICERDY